VFGTVVGVTGASLAVSYFRVDPPLLKALQASLLSVASAYGMGKIVSYIWLRYPKEKLREDLDGEVEALRASFSKVVRLSPEIALPFLEGIASPDNNTHTHPFIREAAFLAIFDCEHPSVTSILERIAQANIRMRGDLKFTERILRRVISRYRDCNQRIAQLGLAPETE